MKTHIKKEQYRFFCGRRPEHFSEESKNLGSTTCVLCKKGKFEELEKHYIMGNDQKTLESSLKTINEAKK